VTVLISEETYSTEKKSVFFNPTTDDIYDPNWIPKKVIRNLSYNGVAVITNNFWNRLEREENIDIIGACTKQKNNMVVDAKDLFLTRAKILLAAVYMSTSTQWSTWSSLKTRFGNNSNIVLQFEVLHLASH